MARRSRQSILKRQREQKRAEKAATKRQKKEERREPRLDENGEVIEEEVVADTDIMTREEMEDLRPTLAGSVIVGPGGVVIEQDPEDEESIEENDRRDV